MSARMKKAVEAELQGLEYYVSNPSAWPGAYCDQMSDVIGRYVDRIRKALGETTKRGTVCKRRTCVRFSRGCDC